MPGDAGATSARTARTSRTATTARDKGRPRTIWDVRGFHHRGILDVLPGSARTRGIVAGNVHILFVYTL